MQPKKNFLCALFLIGKYTFIQFTCEILSLHDHCSFGMYLSCFHPLTLPPLPTLSLCLTPPPWRRCCVCLCNFVILVRKFHFDANERLLLLIKLYATDDLARRKLTIYTTWKSVVQIAWNQKVFKWNLVSVRTNLAFNQKPHTTYPVTSIIWIFVCVSVWEREHARV